MGYFYISCIIGGVPGIPISLLYVDAVFSIIMSLAMLYDALLNTVISKQEISDLRQAIAALRGKVINEVYKAKSAKEQKERVANIAVQNLMRLEQEASVSTRGNVYEMLVPVYKELYENKVITIEMLEEKLQKGTKNISLAAAFAMKEIMVNRIKKGLSVDIKVFTKHLDLESAQKAKLYPYVVYNLVKDICMAFIEAGRDKDDTVQEIIAIIEARIRTSSDEKEPVRLLGELYTALIDKGHVLPVDKIIILRKLMKYRAKYGGLPDSGVRQQAVIAIADIYMANLKQGRDLGLIDDLETSLAIGETDFRNVARKKMGEILALRTRLGLKVSTSHSSMLSVTINSNEANMRRSSIKALEEYYTARIEQGYSLSSSQLYQLAQTLIRYEFTDTLDDSKKALRSMLGAYKLRYQKIAARPSDMIKRLSSADVEDRLAGVIMLGAYAGAMIEKGNKEKAFEVIPKLWEMFEDSEHLVIPITIMSLGQVYRIMADNEIDLTREYLGKLEDMTTLGWYKDRWVPMAETEIEFGEPRQLAVEMLTEIYVGMAKKGIKPTPEHLKVLEDGMQATMNSVSIAAGRGMIEIYTELAKKNNISLAAVSRLEKWCANNDYLIEGLGPLYGELLDSGKLKLDKIWPIIRKRNTILRFVGDSIVKAIMAELREKGAVDVSKIYNYLKHHNLFVKMAAGMTLGKFITAIIHEYGISRFDYERSEIWQESGLPFQDDIVEEYMRAKNPRAYIDSVNSRAQELLSKGFDPKIEKDMILAHAGVKVSGIDISFEDFKQRVMTMYNKGRLLDHKAKRLKPELESYFEALFGKGKGLDTIELSEKEASFIDVSRVDPEVFDKNLEQLMKLKENVDSLKWVGRHYPDSDVFSVKKLYYQLKREQAIQKQEINRGDRYYTEFPSETDMKKLLKEEISLLRVILFNLARNRLADPRIGHDCLTLMRDLSISVALQDEDLIRLMGSADIEERKTAFKNFYGNYLNHLPNEAGVNGIKGIKKLDDVCRELSRPVFEEISKITYTTKKSGDAYRLVPQGFLSAFRGRAGLVDCSFDHGRYGTPYTRAMHEDTLYYFVYKGKTLKGYIGLCVGKTADGEKVLTIDTIQSKPLNGKKLLMNLFRSLDDVAKGLGCIGIALPASELSRSFDFENRNTITRMSVHKKARAIKVTPYHNDTWLEFRKIFHKDKYNSIEYGAFKLLDLMTKKEKEVYLSRSALRNMLRLEDSVNDSSSLVREVACESFEGLYVHLIKQGYEAPVKGLLKKALGGDVHVLQTGTKVLIAVFKELVGTKGMGQLSVLKKLLKSNDVHARCIAVDVLGDVYEDLIKQGKKVRIKDLEAMLEDDKDIVRLAAVRKVVECYEALIEKGQNVNLTLLRERIFDQDGSVSREASLGYAKCLSQGEPQNMEVLAPLQRAMKSKDEFTSKWAGAEMARVLGIWYLKSKDNLIYKKLEALIDNEHEFVRESAGVYLAVTYAKRIEDGEVTSAVEFEEMLEKHEGLTFEERVNAVGPVYQALAEKGHVDSSAVDDYFRKARNLECIEVCSVFKVFYQVFIKRGEKVPLENIEKYLDHEEGEVKEAAVAALATLYTDLIDLGYEREASWHKFEDMIDNSDHAGLRLGLIQALEDIYTALIMRGGKVSVEKLMKMLNDEICATNAAETIGKITGLLIEGGFKVNYSKIMDRICLSRYVMSHGAVPGLASILKGCVKARVMSITEFEDYLDSSNTNIRAAAATALGEVYSEKIKQGEVPYVNKLEKLMDHENEDVRMAAVRAMGLIVSAEIEGEVLKEQEYDRMRIWQEAKLPFQKTVFDEFMQSKDPDVYISMLKKRASRLIRDGIDEIDKKEFDPDNDEHRRVAFIGLRMMGIDLNYVQYNARMDVMADFDFNNGAQEYFRKLFTRIKDMQLGEIKVEAEEAFALNVEKMDKELIVGHIKKLMSIKEGIESLKWIKDYYPEDMRAAMHESLSRIEDKAELYKVILKMVAVDLTVKERRGKAISLIRDLMIGYALLDDALSFSLQTLGFEQKVEAIKNLYDNYARHLRHDVDMDMDKMSIVLDSLDELSKDVYAEIDKAGYKKVRKKETYRLVPQGFPAVFRGRAGIIDCSYDEDKGKPYTRAMHKDNLYYFVYKGKELKGYIGLTIGKIRSGALKGKKILAIDTINSPSLDGEKLLQSVFEALHGLAKELDCIGVALPDGDLSTSFNFSNKVTIPFMPVYINGMSLKVSPLHEAEWDRFRETFKEDEYNAIEYTKSEKGRKSYKRFRLLKALSIEGEEDSVGLPAEKTQAHIGKKTKAKVTGEGNIIVRSSDGFTYDVGLNPHGQLDIANLKGQIKDFGIDDKDYKRIVNRIISLFEKSPPELCSFDPLIEDFFGIASHEHNLIALHRSLYKNPVALFHELGHFLIDMRKGRSEKGLLHLELVKQRASTYIRVMTRGSFNQSFRETARIKIHEATQKFIRKEKWKGWAQDPHYLLRVLQCEMFGWVDDSLSMDIRNELKEKETNLFDLRKETLKRFDEDSHEDYEKMQSDIQAYLLSQGFEEGRFDGVYWLTCDSHMFFISEPDERFRIYSAHKIAESDLVDRMVACGINRKKAAQFLVMELPEEHSYYADKMGEVAVRLAGVGMSLKEIDKFLIGEVKPFEHNRCTFQDTTALLDILHYGFIERLVAHGFKRKTATIMLLKNIVVAYSMELHDAFLAAKETVRLAEKEIVSPAKLKEYMENIFPYEHPQTSHEGIQKAAILAETDIVEEVENLGVKRKEAIEIFIFRICKEYDGSGHQVASAAVELLRSGCMDIERLKKFIFEEIPALKTAHGAGTIDIAADIARSDYVDRLVKCGIERERAIELLVVECSKKYMTEGGKEAAEGFVELAELDVMPFERLERFVLREMSPKDPWTNKRHGVLIRQAAMIVKKGLLKRYADRIKDKRWGWAVTLLLVKFSKKFGGDALEIAKAAVTLAESGMPHHHIANFLHNWVEPDEVEMVKGIAKSINGIAKGKYLDKLVSYGIDHEKAADFLYLELPKKYGENANLAARGFLAMLKGGSLPFSSGEKPPKAAGQDDQAVKKLTSANANKFINIVMKRMPEEHDNFKTCLRAIKNALKVFPEEKVLKYLDSRDDERSLDVMMLDDSHKSVFTHINLFMKNLRPHEKELFLNNVFLQVPNDKGVNSEGEVSHTQLWVLLKLLNSLGQKGKTWQDVLMEFQSNEDMFLRIRKELVEDGKCFTKWREFKRLKLLVNLMLQDELLKEISALKDGSARGNRLHEYYRYLIMHPSMNDFDALRKMRNDPEEFLALADANTEDRLHDSLKASRLLDFEDQGIDLGAEELVSGLITGKLDKVQAIKPFTSNIELEDLDPNVRELKAGELIAYLWKKKYVSVKSLKEALLSYYAQRLKVLSGKPKNKILILKVKKIIKLLKDDKVQFVSILDHLSGAKFDINMLRKAGLELPLYKMRIIPKSDPQAMMTGSEAPSCMSYGHGKNNTYVFNPNVAFLALSREIIDDDGKKRDRILATSVVTADRKIPGKVEVLHQNVSAYAQEGSLDDADMKKLLGKEFSEKVSKDVYLSGDNVEAASQALLKGAGVMSFEEVVRRSYKLFFERYSRRHTKTRRGRTINRSKVLIGFDYSDLLVDLPDTEDGHYYPQAPPAYLDKTDAKVNVIKLDSRRGKQKVNELNGIIPLSYEDSLDMAAVKKKSPFESEFSYKEMQLIAVQYNEAIKGKKRKNLSLGYFEQGKLLGYAIAYIGYDKDLETERIYITDFAVVQGRSDVEEKLMQKLMRGVEDAISMYRKSYSKRLDAVIRAVLGKDGNMRYFMPNASHRRINSAGFEVVNDDPVQLDRHDIYIIPAGEMPAQIGKKAHGEITDDWDLKVVDSKGKEFSVGLENAGRMDIQSIKDMVNSLVHVKNKARKKAIHAILSLLENSPPFMMHYDALVQDLFGLASPKRNVIALYDKFRKDPVAIFHEIGHFLIDKREGVARKGLLTLEYIDPKKDPTTKRRMPFIRIRGRSSFKEPFEPIIDIGLSPQTRKYIEEEGWKEWQKDPHYLLRVIQREVFGKYDKDLSDTIKELQKERWFPWHKVIRTMYGEIIKIPKTRVDRATPQMDAALVYLERKGLQSRECAELIWDDLRNKSYGFLEDAHTLFFVAKICEKIRIVGDSDIVDRLVERGADREEALRFMLITIPERYHILSDKMAEVVGKLLTAGKEFKEIRQYFIFSVPSVSKWIADMDESVMAGKLHEIVDGNYVEQLAVLGVDRTKAIDLLLVQCAKIFGKDCQGVAKAIIQMKEAGVSLEDIEHIIARGTWNTVKMESYAKGLISVAEKFESGNLKIIDDDKENESFIQLVLFNLMVDYGHKMDVMIDIAAELKLKKIVNNTEMRELLIDEKIRINRENLEKVLQVVKGDLIERFIAKGVEPKHAVRHLCFELGKYYGEDVEQAAEAVVGIAEAEIMDPEELQTMAVETATFYNERKQAAAELEGAAVIAKSGRIEKFKKLYAKHGTKVETSDVVAKWIRKLLKVQMVNIDAATQGVLGLVTSGKMSFDDVDEFMSWDPTREGTSRAVRNGMQLKAAAAIAKSKLISRLVETGVEQKTAEKLLIRDCVLAYSYEHGMDAAKAVVFMAEMGAGIEKIKEEYFSLALKRKGGQAEGDAIAVMQNELQAIALIHNTKLLEIFKSVGIEMEKIKHLFWGLREQFSNGMAPIMLRIAAVITGEVPEVDRPGEVPVMAGLPAIVSEDGHEINRAREKPEGASEHLLSDKDAGTFIDKMLNTWIYDGMNTTALLSALEGIRDGLKAIPVKRIFQYLDDKNHERSLEDMLLDNQHRSVFNDIIPFMETLSKKDRKDFINNVFLQIPKDTGVNSNGQNSHQQLWQVIRKIMNFKGEGASWKEKILNAPVDDDEIEAIRKELIEDGICFSKWKSFKRLMALVDFLEKEKKLKIINKYRKGSEEDKQLYRYYRQLVLHPNMTDFAALTKMIEEPDEFLALKDSNTEKRVHDLFKPSRLCEFSHIDLGEKELIEGLIRGKLDDVQAIKPFSMTIGLERVDEKIGKLKGVKLAAYLAEQKYVPQEALKRVLIEYFEAISKKRKTRQHAQKVEKILKLLRDKRAQWPSILDHLKGATFTLKDLEKYTLSLPSYKVRIIPKSDPQAFMTGSEAPSCMEYGTGKNNIYVFNPNCAFLALSKEVFDADGVKRDRILATSVITLDRKIPGLASKIYSAVTKAAQEGKLEALDMRKIMGKDLLGKISDDVYLAADNVEGADRGIVEGHSKFSFNDIVGRDYRLFFEEYFRHNRKTRRGREINTSKVLVGTEYNDFLKRLPDSEPNNYFMQAQPGYYDKRIAKTNYIPLAEKRRRKAKKLDGILPLSYEDSLEIGCVKAKSSFVKDYADKEMELIAATYNEAIKGETRKNLSVGYFDNGKLLGYAIAYIGYDKKKKEDVLYVSDLAVLDGNNQVGNDLVRTVLLRAYDSVDMFEKKLGKNLKVVINAEKGESGNLQYFMPRRSNKLFDECGFKVIDKKDGKGNDVKLVLAKKEVKRKAVKEAPRSKTNKEIKKRAMSLQDLDSYTNPTTWVYQGTVLYARDGDVYVVSVGHDAEVGGKVRGCLGTQMLYGEVLELEWDHKGTDIALIKLKDETKKINLEPINIGSPPVDKKIKAEVTYTDYTQLGFRLVESDRYIRTEPVPAQVYDYSDYDTKYDKWILEVDAEGTDINQWGVCGSPVFCKGALIGMIFESDEDDEYPEEERYCYAMTGDEIIKFLNGTVYKAIEKAASRPYIGKTTKGRITPEKDLIITDKDGREYNVALEKQDKLDLNYLREHMKSHMNMTEENLKVVYEILDVFEANMPDIYLFDNIVGDFFGIASAEENAIAIHRDLMSKPIALLHEIGHFLMQKKSEGSDQSMLSLSWEENAEGAYIRVIMKKDKSSRPKGIGLIKLSKDTVRFVNEEHWGVAVLRDDHYLLRILQWEFFGASDREVSQKIKKMQELSGAHWHDIYETHIRDIKHPRPTDVTDVYMRIMESIQRLRRRGVTLEDAQKLSAHLQKDADIKKWGELMDARLTYCDAVMSTAASVAYGDGVETLVQNGVDREKAKEVLLLQFARRFHLFAEKIATVVTKLVKAGIPYHDVMMFLDLHVGIVKPQNIDRDYIGGALYELVRKNYVERLVALGIDRKKASKLLIMDCVVKYGSRADDAVRAVIKMIEAGISIERIEKYVLEELPEEPHAKRGPAVNIAGNIASSDLVERLTKTGLAREKAQEFLVMQMPLSHGAIGYMAGKITVLLREITVKLAKKGQLSEEDVWKVLMDGDNEFYMRNQAVCEKVNAIIEEGIIEKLIAKGMKAEDAINAILTDIPEQYREKVAEAAQTIILMAEPSALTIQEAMALAIEVGKTSKDPEVALNRIDGTRVIVMTHLLPWLMKAYHERGIEITDEELIDKWVWWVTRTFEYGVHAAACGALSLLVAKAMTFNEIDNLINDLPVKNGDVLEKIGVAVNEKYIERLEKAGFEKQRARELILYDFAKVYDAQSIGDALKAIVFMAEGGIRKERLENLFLGTSDVVKIMPEKGKDPIWIEHLRDIVNIVDNVSVPNIVKRVGEKHRENLGEFFYINLPMAFRGKAKEVAERVHNIMAKQVPTDDWEEKPEEPRGILLVKHCVPFIELLRKRWLRNADTENMIWSLESIKKGLEFLPANVVFQFIKSKDADRPLEAMVLDDAHRPIFNYIKQFMGSLSEKDQRLFANNVIEQVGRDKGLDSEGRTSHEQLWQLLKIIVSTNRVTRNWKEIIMDCQIDDPALAELRKVLIEEGGYLKKWKDFKRLRALVNLVRHEKLNLIKGMLDGTKADKRRYEYFKFLILHPGMTDDNALQKMIEEPDKFLALGDIHAKDPIHDQLKPSVLTGFDHIDLSGEELINGLIQKKLDKVQAIEPMDMEIIIRDLDKQLNVLKGGALIKHMHACGYLDEKYLRKILLLYYERRLKALRNVGKKMKVAKIIKLITNEKTQFVSIVEHLMNAEFDLDALIKSGMLMPRYRIRIMQKSDPQAYMTGSEAPSCMSYGSGKNNVYIFNPNTAFLALSKEIIDEEGERRDWILATSVLTADRKVPRNVSFAKAAIEEGLFKGEKRRWIRKIFGRNISARLSRHAYISADNVESAREVYLKAPWEKDFDGLVRRHYKAFFEKYYATYRKTRRGRPIETDKLMVGTSYSDLLKNLPDSEENYYYMQAPISYSDKGTGDVNVLPVEPESVDGRKQRKVRELNGILPLSYEDSLDIACVKLQATYEEDYARKSMELTAAVYNEAIKGKRRKNLSLGYFKDGKLLGYAIAYVGYDKKSAEEIIYVSDFAVLNNAANVKQELMDRLFESINNILKTFEAKHKKTLKVKITTDLRKNENNKYFRPRGSKTKLEGYGFNVFEGEKYDDGAKQDLVLEQVPETKGQIGKKAQGLFEDGLLKVKDSTGKVFTLLTNAQELDVSTILATVRTMIAPERIALISDLFRLVRPELRTFNAVIEGFLGKAAIPNVIEDLLGRANIPNGGIALFKGLAGNPVALFHEIAHHLIDIRGEASKLGLLAINYTTRNNKSFIGIKIRSKFYHNFAGTRYIPLSEQTIEFIEQEKWSEGWKKNDHYLLRALQHEVFGKYDIELTKMIREAKSIVYGILPVAEEHRERLRNLLLEYIEKRENINPNEIPLSDIPDFAIIRHFCSYWEYRTALEGGPHLHALENEQLLEYLDEYLLTISLIGDLTAQ